MISQINLMDFVAWKLFENLSSVSNEEDGLL